MNILFLCTGNSARSILAEAIYNHIQKTHGHAFSAGSKPAGRVNPATMTVLQNHGHKTEGLRSKNVDEFMQDNAPAIDVVISVCDSAAQDCPVWPGKGSPERLHWPLPDPAAVQGTDEEIMAAFEAVYENIHGRIEDFVESELVDQP